MTKFKGVCESQGISLDDNLPEDVEEAIKEKLWEVNQTIQSTREEQKNRVIEGIKNIEI